MLKSLAPATDLHTAARKAARLRAMLHSGQLEFLLEAHNGLSAKIAEEAGFAGIWASGLALSAQFGVRDSNEASWTQVLEMLEFMADATAIPILLDGDTGYGNFNNARRLVRKLEQRNVSGVCLEDKLFPKTNSFIAGQSQDLADIDEFSGKIKAAKDAQLDDQFVVVARVEAFIAGRGLAEALHRAEAYHQAGADAILIHSALNVPDEVLKFKTEWGNRLPVLIVPTKFYSTPTEVFRSYGFAAVIWANHLLRSSIAAMASTAELLHREQNLRSLEDRIAPLAEVFRLQGADELQEAERRYLPDPSRRTAAVVLAASRGPELGQLTEKIPKAMVTIAGKPLLAHIAEAYQRAGIRDLTVVRGYKMESVNVPHIRYAENHAYETTGELVSLAKGLEHITARQSVIVSYGDVLFRKYIPESLAELDEPFAIAVDTLWRKAPTGTAMPITCAARSPARGGRTTSRASTSSKCPNDWDPTRSTANGWAFSKSRPQGCPRCARSWPSCSTSPPTSRLRCHCWSTSCCAAGTACGCST